MRNLILLALLCVPMIVACGTTVPAFGQPGASVVRVPYAPVGVYTFNFKRDQVYGLAFARGDAVEKYLERNQGVLPPDCTRGVQVLDVVDGENGESAASFKCNPAGIGERQRIERDFR